MFIQTRIVPYRQKYAKSTVQFSYFKSYGRLYQHAWFAATFYNPYASNDINTFPSKLTHISNHRFAECQLSIPGPNILVKDVSHQKFKQIDMDNFRSDIASSLLCNSRWTSLEELAQCYDTTFSQILV